MTGPVGSGSLDFLPMFGLRKSIESGLKWAILHEDQLKTYLEGLDFMTASSVNF